MVQPVPDGYRTVTPHLTMKNAHEAMGWYQEAFGAEEVLRMPGPDGKTVMHGEVKIGDSMVMIAEEFPMPGGAQSPATLSGTTCTVNLYVEDCDALFQRALKAGATALMPPMDMFWGDRYGKLQDPFGHQWAVMTHKEDLTPEQIAERAAEAMKQGDCEP